MLLDPSTLAIVALLALGAAVLGAVGGFGTGIVLTAVLVPLIGAKAVVPVLAVAGVIINAGRFWFYRKSVDLRAVAIVCGAALPMMALGTWIYASLDARTLTFVLAIFVLASIPLRRILKRRAVHIGPRALAAGAGVFGLASGFATGTGVILISLLLGSGISGTAVLATDALASIIVDLAKALLFGRFDLLNEREALLGIAIGVCTIPGSALGAFLVARMGAHLHILVMESLIAAGGLSMLWHALR
ncbi:MAG: sulfite exporter TauE/SafE family protein [Proteobacteria bacterium]|nr:sulfite exporter TauE/SafE family protein [Pseudomonadota bacterium]